MIYRFIEYIQKYPLSLFESFCVIVPIIIGLAFYKKLSKPLLFLWLYPLSYLITDIPIWYRALNKVNNYLFINIQEIIGAVILLIFFNMVLEKLSRTGFLISLLCLLVTAFLGFEEKITSTPIYVVNRIAFIFFCFMFFYQLLEKLNIKNLLYYPYFWIFSGILIYSCGTLFMYLYPQVTVSFDIKQETWTFFSNMKDIFKILLHMFLAIGFGVSRYTKRYEFS